MSPRRLVSSPLFWSITAASALAFGVGCSSSSSSGGGTGSPDASPSADASPDAGGGGGDAAHDGPSAEASYAACAVKGSFGSTCTATASGPDPTDCTDPNYPQCFVGGQGAWCTKACTSATDCTAGASDAGCVPTGCNAKGFCK